MQKQQGFQLRGGKAHLGIVNAAGDGIISACGRGISNSKLSSGTYTMDGWHRLADSDKCEQCDKSERARQ